MRIKVGDLLAIQAVLEDLVADADGLDLEDAVALMETLSVVISDAKRALSALETRVREQLEAANQPRQFGDRVYLLKDESVARHDQKAIVRMVATAAAAPDEHGELPSTKTAALRAAMLMRDLFLAPRDKAKVTILKQVFDDEFVREVTSWESKGSKLEVIDLRGHDDGAG